MSRRTEESTDLRFGKRDHGFPGLDDARGVGVNEHLRAVGVLGGQRLARREGDGPVDLVDLSVKISTE